MTDDQNAPDSSPHVTSCKRLRAAACNAEVQHILRDAITRLRVVATTQRSIVAAVVAQGIVRLMHALDD